METAKGPGWHIWTPAFSTRQESSAFSAVLGDPIPILGALILAGKPKNELVPIKKTIRLFPQPRVWLGISSLIKAVLQDLQFLQRDEAAIHHAVKNGQKLIYLLFRIHDFDDQWQIQR